MPAAPKRATIRSYNVGFGDCFLVSFEYASGEDKHILIDFGSTSLPKGVTPKRMHDIAVDIRDRCGKSKLTAVVATHRHKDHVSGFATADNGKGTGDIIRELSPKIVIQPWTEDPKLKPDAKGPKKPPSASKREKEKQAKGKHIAALELMQGIAETALNEVKHAAFLTKEVKDQLSFLGDDNLANLSAVKNLMTMGKRRHYVYSGSESGLEALVPGVAVDVLGPPTLKQTETIGNQRAKDPDEFWHLQANAMGSAAVANGSPIFPKHVRIQGGPFPVETRWLIYHARAVRGEQLLQIVRALDDAMNNTSVILLFRIGKKSLLFPGDAQIENWKYALDQERYRKLLADVDVYKVGHHGSLNATPKSLWKLFKHRSRDEHAPGRLTSIVSTMAGKHGSEDRSTEVPRKTLVSALDNESNFFSTQELLEDKFFHDVVVEF